MKTFSAILFLCLVSCENQDRSNKNNSILSLLNLSVSKELANQYSTNIAVSEPNAVFHTLDHIGSEPDRKILLGSKSYAGKTDRIFVDGLGREAYFRGFNISGNTKMLSDGFKPFRNTADAENAFSLLGKTAGSNMVRYLIAWEGVHPNVDTIDYAYLDTVILQIKAAIAHRMYILLDYHQDLFSRHLFNKGSWYTGNGAPSWVLPSGSYPQESCGICFTWGQNLFSNEAVRRGFRNFWNNAPFSVPSGTRNLQTEYLWQMGKALTYIKNNLSNQEFDFVLGLDPFNEPADGGMEGLTPAQWDNQKLWPFYQKVRQTLDQNGWENKWVYAEPMVFWNTNFGGIATGGGYLTSKPGQGFVFNSHFYDAGRLSLDLTGIDNGTYFKALDEIRKEARFLDIPVFLSEFGMKLKGVGAQDTGRLISGVYQAMEISDVQQSKKTRFADFYNPVVSGTEWHWDYYYDNHKEYMNGNPSKLLNAKDAWNDEDFSVIGNYGTKFNIDYHVLQRGYPRKVQGSLMSFYYNTIGYDTWNNVFQWGAIRTTDTGTNYFGDRRFIVVIWTGKRSNAPTEVYLPSHFSGKDIVLITDKTIYNKDIPTTPQNRSNESILIPDPNRVSGSGNILTVWDDLDADEDPENSVHFLVAVDGSGANYSDSLLSSIQNELKVRVCVQKKSPIYLIGKMTYGGYPSK
ncbi:cellulase family glycosylhydrolase [Leptospira koniambonensis]|uniref:cellulase family glycosylhydrolase n=1 Tax=Leptospira koniambonensis TaxID=2484950 RepID=UPI003EB9DE70